MKAALKWINNNKEWSLAIFAGVVIPSSFFLYEHPEIVKTITIWIKALPSYLWTTAIIVFLLLLLETVTQLFSNLIFPKKEIMPLTHTKQDQLITQQQKVCAHTPEQRKQLTKILFIDDQTDFKVVNILKKSGWKNTKIIKNVSSVDDRNILEADICFVDINGVAEKLFPKTQGLGLVGAIRERHPDKRVVVYSSQSKRDVFDPLWDTAHGKLAKNATPYEFENYVEIFSAEKYC